MNRKSHRPLSEFAPEPGRRASFNAKQYISGMRHERTEQNGSLGSPGAAWYQRRPLVCLAPMEAVTDRVYRKIVREVAPEVILYTEFVSASGLIHGGERVWKMALFDEVERPIVVQLYDHDADALGRMAGEVARELKPEGIDLNMGCPVRKVTKRGAGCGMMADPENSFNAVKKMVEQAEGIPVSVKTRLGITEKTEVVALAQAMVEAGAKQVTIHARLKADRPRVPADWTALSAAAMQIPATVIGNGDIWTPEDALQMAQLDGVDGVMIGRGAIGNPWLLHRSWRLLGGQDPDPPPDKENRISIALKHLEMNVAAKGERRGVLEMRKMVRNYIKGYPDSRNTWLKIIEVETLRETALILEEFAAAGSYA